jgi:hypothetical protein
MKRLLILLLFVVQTAAAQQYVIDPQHLASVIVNGATRSSAETAHEQYLTKINNNLNDLNINAGSVVLAQTMIYQALSNVNSALKDGLEVKYMAVVVADMTGYISQALSMARSEPYLLLFANNIAAEMRVRALALVSDVSGYVLKEGNNVLADYNARDQLLHKVMQQLQILDGLAYGAWKAMYWAKERGVIASLNPFSGFINRDKTIVSQIIQNANYLRQ